MAGGSSNTSGTRLQTCVVCKSGPLDLIPYVTHILGKRHQKNLKNRSKILRKDEMNRTLHVTGYRRDTSVENIISTFYKYGVINVTTFPSFAFVELKDKQCVKECLGDKHYIADQKLKVNLRHQTQQSKDYTPMQLSWHVQNSLEAKFVSPQSQWNAIQMLINEIELKQDDYDQRQLLRHTMEVFLRPDFPMAQAHVFGSSSNNLGFVGCDVDLFVHLGVDPWQGGSKAQQESKARDLTWYLARKLKNCKRGYKVQAIAKARVPIVKFEDALTGLQVDLSFRNAMPVYNTQLICQYTRTHILVRPYLMVIRYWAKVQDVAGGGQPTYLITNYGLTMLMLFYLMVRSPSIIPSVAQLKSQRPPDFRGEHTINGWDCSFGQNVNQWANRKHNVSVLELVREFFSYYADFEASKWVISPLAGKLLDKEDVKERNMKKLPACMRIYCNQETDLQLATAICLQDPFEHCYNTTRGLQAGPLVEFQYKCKRSAEICSDVLSGKRPLQDLFEDIIVDESVLNEIQARDSPVPKEVDITQEEVITLDDSDELSQDEIEVLDSGATSSTASADSSKPRAIKKRNFLVRDNIKPESDTEEAKKDSSIEILPDENTNESSIEELPNGDSGIEILNANGINSSKCDNVTDVPEILPENKLFKFPLDFNNTREFTITFDGSISDGKNVMTSEDDIGQAACSLVHFILQQCLKMEVSSVESERGEKKRKTDSPENTTSGKRIKNVDGDSVSVVMKHKKVAEYRCCTETQLWVGRKKMSKTVPATPNGNPLQFEMAVTEAQISAGLEHAVNATTGKLDFTVSLWQEIKKPVHILVTGDSLSSEKVTRSMMMPLFMYLSSLTSTLLEKVLVYIQKTSSKR